MFGIFVMFKIALKIGLLIFILHHVLYNISREIPSIYNLNMQRCAEKKKEIRNDIQKIAF